MRSHVLRDDQWNRIKDFLPGREGHVGGTAADNRLFVDAVIFRYRTGVSWRDLPDALLADKGYDSDAPLETLDERGIATVIPPKANRREQRKTDFELCRERNLVERFFNALKQYRGIATRYDKLATTFLAAVVLVCILI